MVTAIRLIGAMKRRINPQSALPGSNVDPDDDAAVVAALEAKLRAQVK